MKLTQKQFELFKSESQKWIDYFELNNWRVDFTFERLEGRRAEMKSNLGGYCVRISLSNEWNEKDEPTNEKIIDSAKHEVIHLLLARFSETAWARCINKDELYEAEEELCRKIEMNLANTGRGNLTQINEKTN